MPASARRTAVLPSYPCVFKAEAQLDSICPSSFLRDSVMPCKPRRLSLQYANAGFSAIVMDGDVPVIGSGKPCR